MCALNDVDIVSIDPGLGGEDPKQDAHWESQELHIVSVGMGKYMVFEFTLTQVAMTHQSSAW